MQEKWDIPRKLKAEQDLIRNLRDSMAHNTNQGIWQLEGGESIPLATMEQSYAQNIVAFFNATYPMINLPYQIIYIALGGKL